MATIVEGLMAATDAMRDAVAQVLALRDDALARVNALIASFRSTTTFSYWCDPINGLDTNDGLTINTPKKSLDAIIGGAGGIVTLSISLMNDAIVTKRSVVVCPVIINGVIKDNTPQGFSGYKRRITFAGTADNSPLPNFGSCCAGWIFYGPSVRLSNIEVGLADSPTGLAVRSAITTLSGLSVSADALTLIIGATTSGYLFGTITGKITATLNLTLVGGAAGHVFDGVAAGANPNALWAYSTNITSA